MLITIEGIDGAGKNTQTQQLKSRLEAEGRNVATLAFPRYGETFMARAVADYLNGRFGDMDASPPHFPALLFAGDRLESRGLLLDLLARHDVLLVDRYVASNMAHQAAKAPEAERAALIDWIAHLEYELYALPRPAATLYLDVTAEVSARLVARKKPRSYTDDVADLHERDLGYLAACRAVYHRLAEAQEGGPWLLVDCVAEGAIRPPEDIHEEIWKKLLPLLKARGAS